MNTIAADFAADIGVRLLADANDAEKYKAGPWGLAIPLLLGIACYFLFRSMSKHMRKVREEFPIVPPVDEVPGAEGDQARAEQAAQARSTARTQDDRDVDEL